MGFVRDGIRALPDILQPKYPSDFPDGISKAALDDMMDKCAHLVTAFFCSTMVPPVDGDCIGSAKPCRAFCSRVIQLCPGILHVGELIGKDGIYRDLFFSKAEENKIYYDLVDMVLGTITAGCPSNADLFSVNETTQGCVHPGDSITVQYQSPISGICNVDLRKSIIKDNEYKTSQWKTLLAAYNEMSSWFFGVTYWMPLMALALNSILIILSSLVGWLYLMLRGNNSSSGGYLLRMIDSSIESWMNSKYNYHNI